MTLDEFIGHLADTKRSWHLDDDGAIRCSFGRCPLTAVALAVTGELYTIVDYPEAAEALELDEKLGEEIMQAADYSDFHGVEYEELRRDLLTALSL